MTHYGKGYPSFGSVIAKMTRTGRPGHAGVCRLIPHDAASSSCVPGPTVGPRYAQVKADGEQLASMKLRYVSSSQLSDRRRLLGALDGFRRGLDSTASNGLDADYQKAS